MKIIGIAQTGFYNNKVIEKKIANKNFELIIQDGISEFELAEKVKDSEYLLLNQEVVGNLTSKFYSAISKNGSPLKYISIDHTGYEWTSPSLAKKNGIIVSNVPHYATRSVAEFTVTTILLVMKKLHEFSFTKAKSKIFGGVMNDDLYDKTVGIVGLGNIGTEVAKILRGFGCKVISWNKTNKKIAGINTVSLKRLFQDSHVITIHLVTNKETESLFTSQLFEAMNNNPYFFNHTSESLIDEKLILKFLDSGKIRTYSNSRKYILDKKLRSHPNCISFPHQGWFTHNSLENLENTWIDNIKSARKGKLINVVNK